MIKMKSLIFFSHLKMSLWHLWWQQNIDVSMTVPPITGQQWCIDDSATFLWWRKNINSATLAQQQCKASTIMVQLNPAPLMMTAFKWSAIPLLLWLGLQCCVSNTVPSTLHLCLLHWLLSSSFVGVGSFCWSGWMSSYLQQWCLWIWYKPPKTAPPMDSWKNKFKSA